MKKKIIIISCDSVVPFKPKPNAFGWSTSTPNSIFFCSEYSNRPYSGAKACRKIRSACAVFTKPQEWVIYRKHWWNSSETSRAKRFSTIYWNSRTTSRPCPINRVNSEYNIIVLSIEKLIVFLRQLYAYMYLKDIVPYNYFGNHWRNCGGFVRERELLILIVVIEFYLGQKKSIPIDRDEITGVFHELRWHSTRILIPPQDALFTFISNFLFR